MREETRKNEKIITPKVIFENNNFICINKPSGWVVNEASTTHNQLVLQNWIRENFDFPIFKNFEMRNGIVHRLDKETSGVLLVAKTEDYFIYLQSLFKERKIQKSYLALCHGKVEPCEATINAPVGRLPWNRERFGVLAGGREATTKYKVKEYLSNKSEEFTLLELFPKTGRTHQIRIHLKYINHPIVSDNFYAGRKTSRNDRQWCPRLFLHAFSLEFLDKENKKIIIESELFDDLKNALDLLYTKS